MTDDDIEVQEVDEQWSDEQWREHAHVFYDPAQEITEVPRGRTGPKSTLCTLAEAFKVASQGRKAGK